MKLTNLTFDFQKIMKAIFYIVPIGIVGNLIFSYLTTDRDAFSFLKNFSANYFIICLMLCFIPWLTHALRMYLWTRFFGKKIRFIELIRIAIGTDLGSAITPTAAGGGYLKAGMFINHGFTPATALSLMFLGSIEDYTFYLIAMPIIFGLIRGHISQILTPYQFDFHRLLLIIAIIIGVLGLFFLIIRFSHQRPDSRFLAPINKMVQKFRNFFKEMKQCFYKIGSKGKKLFVITVLITAIHWICKYSILIMLLQSIGLSVNPAEAIFFQWLVTMISLVVPTPGGAGGAEASFFWLFKALIPVHLMGFITIAWRFFTYYIQLGIGTLFFLIIPDYTLRNTSKIALNEVTL